jgi:hypothetical protein
MTNTFGIYAEAEGHDKPLIMTSVPFGRLMEDIVMPYQSDKPFFVDGAPLSRKQIKKLKIVRLNGNFPIRFENFHRFLDGSRHETQKLYGEQYQVRIEALLRDNGEDVTSQIITAYDRTIKLRLKDYLPKREELIKAALEVFIESVKKLS